MISRRESIQNSEGVGLLGPPPITAVVGNLFADSRPENADIQITLPTKGLWNFSLDPDDKGLQEKWFSSAGKAGNWQEVEVPHTWRIIPEHADYFGTAWYRKEFFVPATWKDKTIRVGFDAAYHLVRGIAEGTTCGSTFDYDLTK